MKLFNVLAKFLFCCLCISACSRQQTAVQVNRTINFAIAQAPLNLDPRYATDAASERVNRLIYQPLVDFDMASKPVPALANWQVIDDRHYRFTLNKNRAPLQSGAILTAVDIKATYDSLLALKDSPLTAEFSNIDSIQVENVNALVFNLKQPDKHFPAKLVIGILPKDLIEKGHDFSYDPVGNGPLQFVSWQNKLLLKRTQDGQFISLQEVKDPTVRVLKLLRGEADLIQGDLPPELVKHLQSKPEVIVKTSVGANYSYLGLNMQDPVLKQLKVRQAIAHAINRQEIIQKVMVTSRTGSVATIWMSRRSQGDSALQRTCRLQLRLLV